MNVKEIVIKYLNEHKYDGLYSEDCGCTIENLFPCGGYGMFETCQAGVKDLTKGEGWIGPREEIPLYKICAKYKCKGGLKNCPEDPECPAMIFYQEKLAMEEKSLEKK